MRLRRLIGSIGFNANYGQDMAFDLSTGILYLAGFDGDRVHGQHLHGRPADRRREHRRADRRGFRPKSMP